MHWFTKAEGFYVYFSAEATKALVPKLGFLVPPFCTSGVLMSANYSTIYKVYFPINLRGSISLLHKILPYPLP
jgi:hypothetical protein